MGNEQLTKIRAEETPLRIFRPAAAPFYTHRAPRGDCDHCDPGRDAAARAERGQEEGAYDQLHLGPETGRPGMRPIFRRQ